MPQYLLMVLVIPTFILLQSYFAHAEPAQYIHQTRADDLLVMALTANNHTMEKTMLGVEYNNSIFIELPSLSYALGFSTNIDSDKGIISGWTFSGADTFHIDIKDNKITTGNTTSPIDGKMLIETPEGIFINIQALHQWFKIGVEFDRSLQTVHLTSEKTFPFLLTQIRKNRYKKIMDDKTKKEMDNQDSAFMLPDIEYDITSIPTIDTTYSIRRGERSLQLRFEGDFIRMLTEGNIQYRNDKLAFMNIKFGQENVHSNLLGPLNATKFYFGDIYGDAFPLRTNSTNGRGFSVSNEPIQYIGQFDSINISGIETPSADIELYRNGILIDYQIADEEGFYSFDNVDLLRGKNEIKSIAYDTYGKTHEKTRIFFVDSNMLPKHSFIYKTSVNQDNTPLVKGANTTTVTSDTGSTRYTLSTKLGLSSLVTGIFDINSVSVDGDRQSHIATGILTSINGIFLRGIASMDMNSNKLAALLETKYNFPSYGTLYAKHSSYNKEYSSEIVNANNSRRLKTSSQVEYRDALNLSILNRYINYTLRTKYDKYTSDDKDITASLITSTSYKGASLSNSITARRNSIINNNNTYLSGTLLMHKNISANYNIRGSLDYNTDDTVLSSTVTNNINNKTTILANVRKNISRSNDYGWYITTNHKFTNMSTGISIGYNTSETGTYANAFISFGITPHKNRLKIYNSYQARKSKVIAHVFVDNNLDNKFNDGDTPLSNVQIYIKNKAYKRYTTDDDGYTLITDITPYRPVSLAIDVSTLQNPFLSPSEQEVVILPKRGSATNIYLATTLKGEIYGYALLENKEPSNDLKVTIENNMGGFIKTATTDSTGFFHFIDLPLGTYTLKHPKHEDTIETNITANKISHHINLNIPDIK